MDKALRIVFMGTPHFALGVLKTLVERAYRVVGVVSAPDKPAGRGLKMQSSPVSEYARIQNIPLLQPPLLKAPLFHSQLQRWNADLFVVVAFRMLPQEVWRLPRLGAFNLHASLLPQYRGAAPINWALMQGEAVTGITTFMIDHQIDTGNVLLQESVAIAPNDTVGTLHDRLMVLGADLVCRTIDALASGTVHPTPQPQVSPLHSAPKLNREICRIGWEGKPQTICNLIRGLSPYPAALGLLHEGEEHITQQVEKEEYSSEYKAIWVKVYGAIPIVSNHSHTPGAIVSDQKNYLHVACRGGWVSLTDLQLSGKKRMSIKEFLSGFRNVSNYRFI